MLNQRCCYYVILNTKTVSKFNVVSMSTAVTLLQRWNIYLVATVMRAFKSNVDPTWGHETSLQRCYSDVG